MATTKNSDRTDHIYRVAFNEPPRKDSDRTEFYFHSLAAIYDVFTPKEVGCKVSNLWNLGVSNGNPYLGRNCTVTREPVARKRQKRP